MATHPLRFFVAFAFLSLTTVAHAAPGDPPAAEPTNVAATITLRDVNIAELIEKMNLDLGYKVTGKVTVVANISVPLGDAATAKAYVLKGKVTSAELTLDNLKVLDLSAEIGYAGGKLTLTELSAKVPSDVSGEPTGEITGSANADIEPRGDLKASLTLAKLPLGILFKTLPGGVDIAGAVGGTVDFRAPVNKVSDLATWAGSANLTAAKLAVFGRAAGDTKIKLDVSDGKAVLTSLETVLEGVPVTGFGTLALSGKYAYTATVRTTPKDVSEIQKLVPELESPVAIRGKLAVEAMATGNLSPFTVEASGGVTATDFALGAATGDKLTAKWKLTRDRVTVTDFTAGVFKGSITGSADVPLKKDGKGDFKLLFKEIDSAAIASTFPKLPVRLTGLVSGDVKGALPAAKPNEARELTAELNLSAKNLTVQGIPATGLVGKLTVDGSAYRYEFEGKTLGGSFEVNGRYPPAKKEEDDEPEGSIVLRGIDLGRLTQALRLNNTRLRGVVDLSFHYSADLSSGSGRYRVQGLGFGDSRLIPELSGRLRLRNGNIELADTVGPISSGTIRARVRASLNTPARNSYRLDIDRADVGRLLSVFTNRPDLVDGAVSLTARGRIWPEFTAAGTLLIPHGRVAGLTVTDLRIPFQFGTGGGGGMKLAIRDITGTLGGGRVTGQFEYAGGATGRIAGQLRFTSVKLGNVLGDLRQTNYFGNARVTGRIDIAGESMRSMDDLTGSVIATIEQAAVRDIPVLSAITPFVSPTALLKPFDSGELRGRLTRGVFRIERLTLASSNAELYADGNVTLGGKLDLGVIVRTGSVGLNDALLRQVGLALPLAIGPIPVSLIRDVSVYLSNRTVRLNLTGTVSQPQPQVNTAALLTEEAVRFFLRRYLPTAAAILPEVSPRSNR